jgi:hypothetical protein
MKTFCTNLRRTILWVLLSSIATLSFSILGQLAPISNWTKVISGTHPSDGELWEDMNPEIEIVGKTIHFLWSSNRYADRSIVYYRNSTDGGSTLNPALAIIDTTGNTNTVSGIKNPNLKRMVVSGNNIHIVIQIKASLYYSLSTNNGISFSPPRIVYSLANATNHDLTEPYISVFEKRVVIGFTETWYSSYMGAHAADAAAAVVSTDGGLTFNPVYLSAKLSTANLRDVIQSRNRIHALIVDDSHHLGRIGISTSTDDGLNFSLKWISDTLITSDNSMECKYDNSYAHKIAIGGNNIYVVWRAVDKDEVAKVFFCRSVDNGSTFEPPVALIDSMDAFYNDIWGASISIAAKGKSVYITCARGWGTAYLLKSNDNGVNFSSRVDMVSDGYFFQYYQNGKLNPSVEFAPSDSTGKDVYCVMNNPKFRHSIDGFNTLGPIKIIDHYASKGLRERTKLSVDENGTAHFVYEYTFGTGNYSERWIYYRAVPLSQPEPSTSNMSLALDYDGSIGRYDNMQIPSTPELCFNDVLTIELWVKPAVGSGNPLTFVFKNRYSSDGVNLRDGFGICTENSYSKRKAIAYLTTTDDDRYAYKILSSTTLEDSIWTHLAMTYDANGGVNNFKLYFNGELEASTTATGNISLNQFESPFFLGGRARSQFAVYAGEADELRFWNRALTKTEIAANMNKELVGNENGLVAYYNFNGTTKDLTGKGNDGILMYKEAYVPRNSVDINEIEYDQSNSKLAQNFPNPFNQSTVIKYTLASDSKVKIRVYNSMGQEIKVLKDEVNSVGNHEVIFKAFKLPNGIYFYDIQANELCSNKIFRESKKMILKK